MNRFQLCNQRAEIQKQTHYQRHEALTRNHFQQHPDLAALVDVERRCSRNWWQDVALWPDDSETEEIVRLGQYSGWLAYAPTYQELVRRPTERDCVRRIQHGCRIAALLEGTDEIEPMVDIVSLWTDVLKEVLVEKKVA